MAYRRRLLEPLKRHSDAFKDFDLSKINDEQVMALDEKQIFADAAHAARNPVVPVGQLLEIETADSTGRQISTFQGSPSATWAP